MSTKGFVRSTSAAIKRIERDQKRQQRELEKQRKQLAKMEEQERAAYEVSVYENHMDVLMSVHKDCGPTWDWQSINEEAPPTEPAKENYLTHQNEALEVLNNFKPSLSDKLMRRVDKKKQELQNELDQSKAKDDHEYQSAVIEYKKDLVLHQISGEILSQNPEAMLEAIKQINPFGEIGELGSSVKFTIDDGVPICAIIDVNGEDVVPSETKTLLKSGKLSVKKMIKTKFYEHYQDYVCGAVLRVARELFALLPVEMVVLTALGQLLNTKTGHMEDQPILSIAIPRTTLDQLNFDMLDPSDSMQNFVHNMKFLKTKGFTAVEKIDLTQFI